MDAREDPIKRVGTRARDGAVDPRPGDFLGPTNAGEADPHGPEVVSPGLHGEQGVRPVRPGRVDNTPHVQDVAETTHTVEEVEIDTAIEAPRRNESRDVWVAYAESLGVQVTDDMSRADVIEATEAD